MYVHTDDAAGWSTDSIGMECSAWTTAAAAAARSGAGLAPVERKQDGGGW
jgi:hypothetical protein